jgi:hypothetical protein
MDQRHCKAQQADRPAVVVLDYTGGALAVERYTREQRDMGTTNLIYILVVIILVLVALLLLAPLL